MDGSGSAYFTGITDSTDFPTMNPAQPALHAVSGPNAFVAKLSASGSALVYLGGSVLEDGFGIAVDSSGSAYVTGFTCSTDFSARFLPEI